MKKKINIHEAKTNFSKIIKGVEEGTEVLVCRSGVAVAQIIPFTERKKKRKPGSAVGMLKVDDSFYDPLPDEILKYFK